MLHRIISFLKVNVLSASIFELLSCCWEAGETLFRGPCAPLIQHRSYVNFQTKMRPEGAKIFFKAGSPPYLRVWMTPPPLI